MTCLLRHWRMRCAQPEPDGKERWIPAPVIYKKSLEESIMKKTARKILALVLTLVLICTLATAAFAATSASVYRKYDNVGIVDAYVSIARRNVTASLVFEPEDGTSYSGSISVSYTYYLYNHVGMNDYRTASVSQTINSPRTGGTATKTYAAGEIFSMRSATATFNADMETVDETIDFHPTRTVTFPYPSE